MISKLEKPKKPMSLDAIEFLIKKQLSLTDRQFRKLFGESFGLLKREQELRKIARDARLVRYQTIKR
jgi:hypothetical protein